MARFPSTPRLFLSAILALGASPAAPEVLPSLCLLEVHGRTYIDGPCQYGPPMNLSLYETARQRTILPDGTESIRFVPRYWTTTVERGSPDILEGWWNEEPFSMRAEGSLGRLIRSKQERGCWVSDIARLCAW